MPNLKPYRTKAQKAEARRLARKDADGAWRSAAPFSIHGQPGEWIWDKSHKVPVRKSDLKRARQEGLGSLRLPPRLDSIKPIGCGNSLALKFLRAKALIDNCLRAF